MEETFYRKKSRRFDIRAGLKKLLRNRTALVLILASLCLGGYFVFGTHGILQRIRLQEQKKELERKIREADEETKSLQSQSKSLENDHKAVEKVARERYGMARKGEKVYKVNKEDH